jgi:hypothetical protein
VVRGEDISMEWDRGKDVFAVPGFSWRIAATIMLGVIWLSFLILWLIFWAGDFDVYQNLAIVFVSIIVVIGLLGAMWASWGLRYARKYEGKNIEWKQQWHRWFGWRGIASGIIWIGWIVWLIVWLFFYAGNYNFYQNLAIFIVSLLAAGGISGVIWGTLGRRMRW